jgi:hypothetical protein
MRAAKHPWKVTVRLDDVPEAGRRFVLEADEATRAAIARQAGVPGIERLDAAFDLTRAGRDGVRVTGQVLARVRQTCVVSLEPLDSEIKESVDLAFVLGAPGARASTSTDPVEIVIGAPEPPELLIDGTVHLGAIAAEFLILGIDPYPRRPDAVFEAQPAVDAGVGPFAALAALKKSDGEP